MSLEATLPGETSWPSPAAWPGWTQHIDEVLQAAGGGLHWRRLESVLVARYCVSQLAAGERDAAAHCLTDELIRWIGACALASIPEEYLSRQSGLVRLSAAAGD
ncbi:unnamed protein product [Polarella glacialis]|uniref:Uncharacterized protein n=1 Tax=Polarella glacialis TaxID=89957 RepID=A0A813JYH4_POLGL|nr:unnamed protein product [Polarella glacialis]